MENHHGYPTTTHTYPESYPSTHAYPEPYPDSVTVAFTLAYPYTVNKENQHGQGTEDDDD